MQENDLIQVEDNSGAKNKRGRALIEQAIIALRENGFKAYLAETREELISTIEQLTVEGELVSSGGSLTLTQLGIVDYLRESDRYDYLDRYAPDLTGDEIREIMVNSFMTDTYFTSANAITLDGQLYFVDGNGNRAAAVVFGPKSVIVIAGANKIVKDMEQARQRVRDIAAPCNNIRLNRSTPCTKTGYCIDCDTDYRTCCNFVTIGRQGANRDRIKVILLPETLGY